MASHPTEIIPSKADPLKISIHGRIDDRGFHMSRVLARQLVEANVHVSVEEHAMVETEWELWLKNAPSSIPGADRHKLSPLVVYNDNIYVGDYAAFHAWAAAALRHKGRQSSPVVGSQMAKSEYRKWLAASPNKFAYLDIAIGSGAPQRVVFQLYTDKCPKTCENFLALCTGEKGVSSTGTTLHYKDSPIHRVVPGGWVQGGDIEGGHGDGGQSIFGPTFPDESFEVLQDRPGVLVMANAGAPHTNGSQFYVTLAPTPWMDKKRVAFGMVISGMRTFRVIEKMSTCNQRPLDNVTITDCGSFPLARGSRSRRSSASGAGAGTGK